ncbi:tetratricopeptide repeat protein [Odoribacter sp. OttesenSCG-928-J03]|nr:tetratricopeptide repeat protein [Odoribacter sp. OttesenSCG-928-J03]
MKKYILLLPFLFVVYSAWAEIEDITGIKSVDEYIRQAEVFYKEGKYREAAESYENILKADRESSKLYYNLGNAYFKSGENTKAILNYERALLLNPSDKDTRYNLNMAQKQIVDKIEDLPEFFFARWYKSLIAYFSADQWAYISIAVFLLFLISALFFFYSSTVGLKKAGFSVASIALLMTVFTIIFTAKQNARLEARNYAIIMTPSVTIKGAPDNSGTSLFVVHEGLKVEVREKLGDWYNIRLQDGNEGWVSKADAEII